MKFSTIFFVGNGMDKAADYPTGYGDFYQSAYFKKLIKDNNPIAMYVQEKNSTIENWADLEQELFNYANSAGVDISSIEKDFKELRMTLCAYIYKNAEYSRHQGYNKKVLDLKHFLSQLYSEDKNIGFISFNYTTIFDDLWEETNKVKPSIQHVHGTVSGIETDGSNIVLGIDETMNVGANLNFLYKPFSPSYNNFEITKKINEAKRIIIFGCSMGESDQWYFDTIFKNSAYKIVEIIAFGENEILRSKQRIKELTGRNFATFSSETNLLTFDNTYIGTLIHSRDSYYKYDNPSFLDSLKSNS